MAMGTRETDQPPLWIATSDLPTSPGHPFYARLTTLLDGHHFDRFVEGLCDRFYAPVMGRPSLAPGRYFRLLLVGYFEGIDSERGIAWRAADSLAVRSFLRLAVDEAPARNFYSQGTYEVTSPSGKKFKPSVGNYFRVAPKKFADLDADGRIQWGPDGNSMPRLKRFLSEVKKGVVPQTLWLHSDVGHTQDAKKELVSVLDFEKSEDVFDTVKPTSLIRRILQIATDKDSIVLDSFAGSGTTAHAVLALNKEDGGNRRFVLIECENYVESITAERVRRVIKGVPRDSQNSRSRRPMSGSPFARPRLRPTEEKKVRRFDALGIARALLPSRDMASLAARRRRGRRTIQTAASSHGTTTMRWRDRAMVGEHCDAATGAAG